MEWFMVEREGDREYTVALSISYRCSYVKIAVFIGVGLNTGFRADSVNIVGHRLQRLQDGGNGEEL